MAAACSRQVTLGRSNRWRGIVHRDVGVGRHLPKCPALNLGLSRLDGRLQRLLCHGERRSPSWHLYRRLHRNLRWHLCIRLVPSQGSGMIWRMHLPLGRAHWCAHGCSHGCAHRARRVALRRGGGRRKPERLGGSSPPLRNVASCKLGRPALERSCGQLGRILRHLQFAERPTWRDCGCGSQRGSSWGSTSRVALHTPSIAWPLEAISMWGLATAA